MSPVEATIVGGCRIPWIQRDSARLPKQKAGANLRREAPQWRGGTLGMAQDALIFATIDSNESLSPMLCRVSVRCAKRDSPIPKGRSVQANRSRDLTSSLRSALSARFVNPPPET
jgi:hypothetical protein